MKILEVKSLCIPDIKVIHFARFCDARGYFTEPFRSSDFKNHPELTALQNVSFVQINESFSKANTIRGLHFQWTPYMGKLVRTLRGRMVDLFLDIRKGSPTYGKIAAYAMPTQLDNPTTEWIWIPPGFAHGNYFTEESQIEYLCSGEYSQGCEAGISPFAQDIDWTLCDSGLAHEFKLISTSQNLLITDKDKDGLSLQAWTQDQRSANFIYGKL